MKAGITQNTDTFGGKLWEPIIDSPSCKEVGIDSAKPLSRLYYFFDGLIEF
jgi:hypothetical protein